MDAALTLSRLYDAHADAIFGFALSLAGQDADARDVLQAVFVKLAHSPTRLEGVRHERAYVLQIAHRTFIDLVRRRAARERAHAGFAAETETLFFEPAEDGAVEATSAELAAALAQLPETQRAVVHLKIWEHLTFEEIGALLELPKGTIVSRYRSALDRLQSALDAARRAPTVAAPNLRPANAPLIPPTNSLLA